MDVHYTGIASRFSGMIVQFANWPINFCEIPYVTHLREAWQFPQIL